jgi:hypothetical protein
VVRRPKEIKEGRKKYQELRGPIKESSAKMLPMKLGCGELGTDD